MLTCRISLAVITVIALSGGCEPRVEEPTGASGWTVAPDPPPARLPGGLPVGPPDAPLPAKRCVRPTPPAPTRKVVPGAIAMAECPKPPDGIRILPLATISFPQVGHQLVVEVARRYADRMRGLMYRSELREDRGMLFVFEDRQRLAFWMRNTCISLDMLFIDSDGLIVGIEENVPILNDNTYQVGCHGRYVLEVNAGWARRHGVMAGQYLDLTSI